MTAKTRTTTWERVGLGKFEVIVTDGQITHVDMRLSNDPRNLAFLRAVHASLGEVLGVNTKFFPEKTVVELLKGLLAEAELGARDNKLPPGRDYYSGKIVALRDALAVIDATVGISAQKYVVCPNSGAAVKCAACSHRFLHEPTIDCDVSCSCVGHVGHVGACR